MTCAPNWLIKSSLSPLHAPQMLWCGQSNMKSRNWAHRVRADGRTEAQPHTIWRLMSDRDFCFFRSQDGWTNWYWYSLFVKKSIWTNVTQLSFKWRDDWFYSWAISLVEGNCLVYLRLERREWCYRTSRQQYYLRKTDAIESHERGIDCTRPSKNCRKLKVNRLWSARLHKRSVLAFI